MQIVDVQHAFKLYVVLKFIAFTPLLHFGFYAYAIIDCLWSWINS